jgi:hypothetical protein
VDFHEGVSVYTMTELLERLIGVPGLESEGRAPTESDRKRLAGWGLIPEGEEPNADRLRELLFRIDRGAVEATFRFYKTTGYFPRDPRRNNVILNVVEGRWVFRVIDYEHMSPFASPRDVLTQYYQVFETEAPDGCFVERGIRPWSWGFLDDKTGFFEGVLGGLGERGDPVPAGGLGGACLVAESFRLREGNHDPSVPIFDPKGRRAGGSKRSDRPVPLITPGSIPRKSRHGSWVETP